MRAFPILALSGEPLSAALGFVFDARWVHRHESLLSMLWKFSLINGAPAHWVIPYLDAQVDPYAGIAPLRRAALCVNAGRLLGVSRHVIARGLLTESAAAVAAPHLRFCRICAQRGFHSVLFQLEHVRTCPLHPSLLLYDQCPFCREPTPHHLSVLTLENTYACAQCGRSFTSALATRLAQPKQPEGRKVPAFEKAYWRHGYDLLGYPGTRATKPFTTPSLPPKTIRALRLEYYRLVYEQPSRAG